MYVYIYVHVFFVTYLTNMNKLICWFQEIHRKAVLSNKNGDKTRKMARNVSIVYINQSSASNMSNPIHTPETGKKWMAKSYSPPDLLRNRTCQLLDPHLQCITTSSRAVDPLPLREKVPTCQHPQASTGRKSHQRCMLLFFPMKPEKTWRDRKSTLRKN